jgi:outer membrane protein assembly factor BamB
MSGRRLLGAAAVVATLAACGGGMTSIRLFTTDWSDDQGKSIEAVRLKLGSKHPAPGADLALGIAGSSDKLVGLPLAGGARWTFAHPLDSRPVIAGSLVIGSGSGELFALDAATGKRVWARQTGGLKVHGAGDDGSVTVVTMSSGTGLGSVLLAIARDGSVVRQVETEQRLGSPAVLGGYAFVPWNSVYVSVLDIEGGDEAARVVMREATSRAWTQGGELYFGEIGIFRFDDHIKGSDKNLATHVGFPIRELPGSPKLMVSGTESMGPAAEAPDRIRVYARPTPGEGALGIDSDRYYATYFRLVMGFDAGKGNLAWVHTHASDVIGGAAGVGSVALCDEQGHLSVLDAHTGGAIADLDLGEPVKGCVVQVDAFHAPGEPAAVPPLATQLADALLNREAQLATAKRLLLRELAALKDDVATKTLIELASDERTSPMLLPDARKALADRRNGATYMLEALGRHYDYLRDVLRPPPVGPIAQALGAMDEKRAAPLLASHLLDPADTDDDVRRAAEALVRLAGPSEAPELTQFFAMYRGTAPNEDVATAVLSVAQALAKVGGKDGQARIVAAMQDVMTQPEVRERLKALVIVTPPDTTGEAPPSDAAPDAGAKPPAKKK